MLRLLRPAEAAARRLVVIAARGLVVTLPPQRPRKPNLKAMHAGLRRLGIAVVMSSADIARAAAEKRAAERRAAARAGRPPVLPLIDPLRLPRRARVRRVPPHSAPRILFFFDGARPPHRLPPPPRRDDPLDATRIGLRLAALASALDDLPGHALRLARWTARRRRAREQGRRGRSSPLKPGRAAGLPRRFSPSRPAHEVHDILRDLHGLAHWALEKPDTS